MNASRIADLVEHELEQIGVPAARRQLVGNVPEVERSDGCS